METRFSNKYNTLPPDYLLSEQGASTFSYQPYTLWWSATKLLCDCYGHLAVVDTSEKQSQLLEQV